MTAAAFVERLGELVEKATPGPWTAKLNHWVRWEIHYAAGQLATLSRNDDPASPPQSQEIAPNAHLTVFLRNNAAALREVVDKTEKVLSIGLEHPWVDELRAALAKLEPK